MGQRIGVFGGSFNPIHTGHLILAQDVLEACDLDEICFVPCGSPAHKDPVGLADGQHRLNMVGLVMESDYRFRASCMEVDRPRTSYTIETLEQLAEEQPEDEFVFVVGTDSLPELHSWRRIHDLLDRFMIVSLIRPGFEPEVLKDLDFQLIPGRKEQLLERVVRGHAIGISSSEIRMRVAEGLGIRYLVPGEVEMYIAEHRLYGA